MIMNPPQLDRKARQGGMRRGCREAACVSRYVRVNMDWQWSLPACRLARKPSDPFSDLMTPTQEKCAVELL